MKLEATENWEDETGFDRDQNLQSLCSMTNPTLSKTVGNGTPTVVFPLYDAHGNIVGDIQRGASGTYAVNDERTYDAWGSIRAGAQQNDPKGRYCASLGHKADDETGFIYMRARYYEPSTARFLSEDRRMNGNNWFAYGKNCPTMFGDQSGCDATDLAFAVTTLTLLAGVLLFGSASDLSLDIALLTSKLADIQAVLSITGSRAQSVIDLVVDGKDVQNTIDQLNRLKAQQGFRKVAGAGAVVVALIGYSMIISALCMDVDLAADGPGALETLFGGHR